jgi:hypothetical protein
MAEESRWKWRQISPRRVGGTLACVLGLVLIASSVSLWLGGTLEDSQDGVLLVAGVVLALAGTAVLWRVPKAPWP